MDSQQSSNLIQATGVSLIVLLVHVIMGNSVLNSNILFWYFIWTLLMYYLAITE